MAMTVPSSDCHCLWTGLQDYLEMTDLDYLGLQKVSRRLQTNLLAMGFVFTPTALCRRASCSCSSSSWHRSSSCGWCRWETRASRRLRSIGSSPQRWRKRGTEERTSLLLLRRPALLVRPNGFGQSF